MNLTVIVSILLNILVIVAFIFDRIYRIHSIKEYKEAKEAQIESLKQQLDSAVKNNDLEIAEMHLKRVENVKVILKEREADIEILKQSIQDLNLKAEEEKTKISDETYKILYGEIIKNYINASEKRNTVFWNFLSDKHAYPLLKFDNDYTILKNYYNKKDSDKSDDDNDEIDFAEVPA